MMKQFMRALLCLCLLLPIGAKAEIFVFGDSLSDTGNAAAFGDVSLLLLEPPIGPIAVPIGTVGLCNPVDILILGKSCDDLFFLQSRVSNGPVAVEVLASALLEPSFFFLPLPLPFPPVFPNIRPTPFGTNYAVAGARAGGSSLGDLNAQIAGFLTDFPSAPSDALYVVFIGGNDVRDARSALVFPLTLGPPGSIIDIPSPMISPLTGLTPVTIIANAVSAIDTSIRQLITAGARTFLVVNSPDIGSLPETRTGAAAAEELLGIPARLIINGATRVTRQFNSQLALRLRQIRLEQKRMGDPVELNEFDLFAFLEGIRAAGSELGFVNTDDACFNSALYQATGIREFDEDCGAALFNTFVFFDAIHPTAKVHEIVGNALSELVDD